MDRIKYALPSASGFLKQIFNFTKTGRFVSWTFRSWTFCNWTFGNWTFCILDVLYPGCSVTGRLVTGRFVTGRYVTGRFVGVPYPWPLSMPLGSFQFFSKIRGDNRKWMLFSGVNDTGDKR
jgi:hypothetical protein